MLDAADLDAAVELASVPGQSSGQHFNLGVSSWACRSGGGNGGCAQQQISIETSPAGTTMQQIDLVPGGRYVFVPNLCPGVVSEEILGHLVLYSPASTRTNKR